MYYYKKIIIRSSRIKESSYNVFKNFICSNQTWKKDKASPRECHGGIPYWSKDGWREGEYHLLVAFDQENGV